MNRIEFVTDTSTHPVYLVHPVRHFWSGVRLLLGLCGGFLSALLSPLRGLKG